MAAPRVEANDRVEGGDSPPDLKESFAVGPFAPTGDPDVDAVWFPPNVWPEQVPALREAVTAYCTAMTRVAGALLELCAGALGQEPSTLRDLATHPTWTFNINRYRDRDRDTAARSVPDRPAHRLRHRHPARPGARAVGGCRSTSRGTVGPTRRTPPGALTVNVGDLLAHWTGHRWRAGRHRVLPPQTHAPTEDLVSLVFFFELDHDAVVTPLAPPLGRTALEPVVSAPFLRER
ncbi:isopenicillin N synthase family oxygenase, partial [Pseudonocardia sp. ICBG601]|uniref:isopenicillin N synthase family oxygenase n=1 Tax=Pseudonocardia sp. ICBG601 TaxID=2846759 RepID=UPI001CF6FB50